ncbi:hypothetical protein [Kineosporia babensis]|uniref:Uncharacterized protein n=1 Tax=Kineosporia babensis TaxID=499548 RepID=A0A9X1NB72_9ACTN|nr:hypothetical protein [Kineosporia babensis]MCD5310895.1 hypothetical protein [Kineosporia babensis]
MSEILTWTGLPGAHPRDGWEMTAKEAAEIIRSANPDATVTVEGRFVKLARPSGGGGTWIGQPFPSAYGRLAKLERFAELVGPIVTDPGFIQDMAFGDITEASIDEMYELAQELGVKAS